ncbi:MAG TPA: NUDIX domain-containing protein [Anaerolineales bacterium]|nr:NUDIX domain-containing protein [Anaerolineales bacterium]
MRTRAGVILIEENKVALIERHRAGLDYFVFPGGRVEEGETVEQGAIREAIEELGIEVAIRQKVAIIHFGFSKQVYFLVERIGGEFGSGAGEEFLDVNIDSSEGVYVPIWMPISDLSTHTKVYPADVANLVVRAQTAGWADEPIEIVEKAS